MKKVLFFIVLNVFVFAGPVFAGELELKRDLAQERVARVQLEMDILRQQFNQRKALLEKYQADLAALEAQVKAQNEAPDVNK